MSRGDSVYSYRLVDGSTRYSAMYRTADGTQHRRRGFETRAEARAWRTQLMARVLRGEEVLTHSDRFDAYIDGWLLEQRARIERGSYEGYEVEVRLRLKPYFGAMRLEDIEPRDVRRYVGELVRAGRLRSKTINNSIAVLSVALNHAVEDGLLARNPARSARGGRMRIKLPSEHREMDYLRMAEIPVYVAACSAGYRPLAEVLIGGGLRISEALGLLWRDVELDRRQLRILRSVKYGEFGSTKGDRSRAVSIGPRLAGVLAAHAEAAGARPGLDDRVVFPGGSYRFTRDSVSREFHKQALAAAGLRSTIRLHDLRHTAAASWLVSGLPMIYVQRQLGHASITTTHEMYGHLEESFLTGAPIKAEAAIWGGAEA